MSASIARGGAPRRGARKTSRARPARGRATAPAAPLPASLRRLGWLLVAGVAIAFALAVLLAMRVPQRVGLSLGEAIGESGFTLRHVEIKDAVHIPKSRVYEIALNQPSRAMPLLDLDATRARLLRFGWIKEARVSRRLPDTLMIDIVERVPAAIWQHKGSLALIDAEGAVLEPVRLESMPDLPLVIGAAANRHVAALDRLVALAPHLKDNVAGATWIGGRRWDLRFQSGETLALPEGARPAARALSRFAAMDRTAPLLGSGYARFDMRDPRKMVVRLSNEPGVRVPPQARVRAPRGPPPDASSTI